MNVAQLQTALTALGHKLVSDGFAGKRTMRAVDDLLKEEGVDFSRWSDQRRRVAAEQIVYKRAEIEVGPIDGLIGEQTRHAQRVWDGRRLNDGKPNPHVENWRDEEEGKPVLHVPNKAPIWPKQADVARFFGGVGDNQTRIELPFPMRIAWDPEDTIKSVSCHEKVAEPLRRIWTRTLEHYGHEKIQELRLDMFGGCLNVRKMRGGSAWSMHSWGIAWDVDPERNQLKWGRTRATLDEKEYDPFWQFVEDEGGVSLGRARNYDWMHFQFARL